MDRMENAADRIELRVSRSALSSVLNPHLAVMNTADDSEDGQQGV